MKKPKGEYAIQTVVNALRVLEAFHEEDELGVTELSRRLSLHKNNVFRLLATLEERGYIDQHAGTERYGLGVKSLELGQSFARNRSLLRSAVPKLTELVQGTGETAHLAVLRDHEVIHLCGDQKQRAVMTELRVGRYLPAHCTALGKVLLGCAPEGVRHAYDRERLVPHALKARTQASITDPDKLREHLQGVSVRGYALDLGECDVGLCCAAAPVYGVDGKLCAALSVSGPEFRMAEEALLGVVAPFVVETADRLSRDLGYGA
ncbi:MAG: IclR family transcriptional regulator [Myxococcota bacterium]|nr:IclR family transcriptional regulator [bacterium]MDP6076314.1 IclR family transcriptional regulator [Myxococcota bacterium]MDP6244836.1 IclR family transcriptional regulator [Myxococcota bacterium]MDP7074840.1 IclR family transcriptional regulator [Myxococcota bacterium]MDP7299324.1 IclR family transcriptional regulator [Myxococcota bacterium]